MSGSFMIALSSVLSFAMISFGVPAGAATADHDELSYPLTPASLMLGRSGSACMRFRLVTASARTCPDLMKGTVEIALLNSTWIWPAMRSVSDGAELLYGMWTISVFVIRQKR